LSPGSVFFFFFKHLIENRNSGELAILSWSLPPCGTKLRNKVLQFGQWIQWYGSADPYLFITNPNRNI
jgi:hypothetical protein